jgi:hypothetical protein
MSRAVPAIRSPERPRVDAHEHGAHRCPTRRSTRCVVGTSPRAARTRNSRQRAVRWIEIRPSLPDAFPEWRASGPSRPARCSSSTRGTAAPRASAGRWPRRRSSTWHRRTAPRATSLAMRNGELADHHPDHHQHQRMNEPTAIPVPATRLVGRSQSLTRRSRSGAWSRCPVPAASATPGCVSPERRNRQGARWDDDARERPKPLLDWDASTITAPISDSRSGSWRSDGPRRR